MKQTLWFKNIKKGLGKTTNGKICIARNISSRLGQHN
jgi:hypothetical protein